MVNQDLLDYVKRCLEQGMGKEDIRKTLIQTGWQVGEVEAVLSSFGGGVVKKSNLKLILSLGLLVLILAGGGVFWWQKTRTIEVSPELLKEKLATIKSAHFSTKFSGISDPTVTGATKLLMELNFLNRDGDIILPDKFSYKLGVASPLPKDKNEKDKILSELELGGMLLAQQGNEYIGVGDQIFTRDDANILEKAGVIDDGKFTVDQLKQFSEWRDATGAGIEQIALPIELFYLKNIAGIVSEITKAGEGKFIAKVGINSLIAAYQDMQNRLLQTDPLNKGNNVNSSSLKITDEAKKQFEVFYNNSELVINLSKGGDLNNIIFEIKEPKGTSTSSEAAYFPSQTIEFSLFNSPIEIKAPVVSGINTKESREAFENDYSRRSSANFVSDAITSLYNGRNSFPLSEKEVNLDDFGNPVVAALIQKLTKNRMDQTGPGTEADAVDFWKKKLVDPSGGKYHYTYKSVDSGDSFVVGYFQEMNKAPENYSGNEKRTCGDSGCSVKITVTGKHVRDMERKYRIRDLVPGLSVLKSAGNLKSFPILTNVKLGTPEAKVVEDLMKTSGLLKKYVESKDTQVNIRLATTFDTLIKDPDFPRNYFLYFSDGSNFGIKARLENSPDQNNKEALLKDFCDPSDTIFQRHCEQENGAWYLIEENKLKDRTVNKGIDPGPIPVDNFSKDDSEASKEIRDQYRVDKLRELMNAILFYSSDTYEPMCKKDTVYTSVKIMPPKGWALGGSPGGRKIDGSGWVAIDFNQTSYNKDFKKILS